MEEHSGPFLIANKIGTQRFYLSDDDAWTPNIALASILATKPDLDRRVEQLSCSLLNAGGLCYFPVDWLPGMKAVLVGGPQQIRLPMAQLAISIDMHGGEMLIVANALTMIFTETIKYLEHPELESLFCRQFLRVFGRLMVALDACTSLVPDREVDKMLGLRQEYLHCIEKIFLPEVLSRIDDWETTERAQVAAMIDNLCDRLARIPEARGTPGNG